MKVSIICPSNRPEQLPHLTEMYHRQDYKNKELIVITGDGTIGAKRNEACERAKGELIINFDDDDYYTSDYVSRCVSFMANSGANVSGLSTAYFYQKERQRAWKYEYRGAQSYVIGSGMCYYRHVWERNKFKDVNMGEELSFVANAGYVKPHGYIEGFCAAIHPKNTASHLTIPYMNEISIEYLKKQLNFEL